MIKTTYLYKNVIANVYHQINECFKLLEYSLKLIKVLAYANIFTYIC